MTPLRDNSQRASLLIAALWIVLATDVLSAISGIFEYRLITAIVSGEYVSTNRANASDIRQMILGLVSTGATILCVIAFIQWFRRAYYNLHQRFAGLKHDEAVAAWSWFVPFLNLVWPYQIMMELYERTREALKERFPDFNGLDTTAVGFWWAAWIINGITGNIALRLLLQGAEGDLDHLLTISKFGIFHSFIGIPTAILAIIVVKRYAKQEFAFDRLRMVSDASETVMDLIETPADTAPEEHAINPEHAHLGQLLNVLRTKNDKYIQNIVEQDTMSSEYVEAGRIIYKERNLDSPEKQELLRHFTAYVSEANLLLERGQSTAEARAYLVERGIAPEHAAELVTDHFERRERERPKGIPAFVIILIVITLLRFAYQCAT